MSSGTVAVRYAKALLAYAVEQGCQDEVYEQTSRLLRHVAQYPDIMKRVSDPTLSVESRQNLLITAFMDEDCTPACTAITDFVRLVVRAGRGTSTVFIASTYRDLYRKKYNVVPVEIRTAHHVSDGQRAELERMIRERAKSDRIEWNEVIDESLIGGFVLQIDDRRIDASVARKLRTVERELIAKNSRII